MIFKAMRFFNIEEWLAKSAPALLPALKDLESRGGFSSLYLKHDEQKGPLVQNYAMILSSCLMNYEAIRATEHPEMLKFVKESYKSTLGSDHPNEDYHGTDLGGEWDIEGFIIRCGVLLSLGALEEFERGTLRILCSRKDTPCHALFYPRLADYTKSSPSWATAERTRKTQTVSGRHLMMREFGIDADSKTVWNKRIQQMRTDRNTIAHGIKAISPTFQSFLQLHYDIFCAVNHVSNQAKLKCGIVL